MKKILALLLAVILCFSLCACGGRGTSKNGDKFANLWSEQKMVDEFGDVIEGSKSIIQCNIVGYFSNTATTNSELTGYVYMYFTDGYPEFSIKLLEYGNHLASYTSYDSIAFKIKLGDSIISYHPVFYTPPNGNLRIYDSNENLYTALYKGEDVRCIVEIGNSKYNFTLYADNFAKICEETGYITQALYFSKTDKETLYNEAKQYIEDKDYYKAIAYLEYLGDYEDCQELLLETVCNGKFYNVSGDKYTEVKNSWKQFFDQNTATPLTDKEIEKVIVGNWYAFDGDSYSTYTKDGKYIYNQQGEANKWFVENNRLVIDYEYFTSEKTIYHFYKNVYVFRTHQSSSDVYEIYFKNGPLE